MIQHTINVVKGDKDYDLGFTLTDFSGVVIVLTNATLKFNAQLLPDSAVSFTGTMVIVSAIAGTCKYTVQATDFPVAGTYNCQIQVSYPYGEAITFADFQVVVEENIPITP